MSNISIKGAATGTGVFTLESPATNTGRTLVLPDEAGTILTTATAGVPIGGPAFSAYTTAAQTLSAGSTTKIVFPTELWDTNNNFASSRFTPTVAGYYQLNVNVGIASGQSGQLLIGIRKNGSVYKHLMDEASFTYGLIGGCLVEANGSTDYFEVYIYTANGFSVSNIAEYTWFDGAMVRSL